MAKDQDAVINPQLSRKDILLILTEHVTNVGYCPFHVIYPEVYRRAFASINSTRT